MCESATVRCETENEREIDGEERERKRAAQDEQNDAVVGRVRCRSGKCERNREIEREEAFRWNDDVRFHERDI